MFEFFQSLGQHILDGIIFIANLFINLISNIWVAFKEFIADLFRIVILFFKGVWYLIEKVFDIVVLVVQVIFGLFKVVWSVVIGIFNTFSTMLGFRGSTDYYNIPQAYQQGFDGVTGFLNQTGLNTIAMVAMVFVWILTAYAVIRIAGGER